MPHALAGLVTTISSASVIVRPPLTDTVFTRAIPPELGWFDQLLRVANGLLILVVLAYAIIFGPAVWSLRKTHRRLHEFFERTRAQLDPIIKSGTAIGADVSHVTGVIRADIGRISETVSDANERVQRALELTEQRLDEFGALLAVIQREVERLFVTTAATVRGVRAGAAAFRGAGGGGPEFASEEVDPMDEALDDCDLEEADGDDSRSTGTQNAPIPPAPRIRSRRSEAG